MHFWLDHYSSFTERQSRGEALQETEKAAGWLEWGPNRKALEDKYGPITHNKIGAILKTQNGNQKLRHIPDLKRTGVNSPVRYTERLILPRLAVARDDVLHAVAAAGHENWGGAVMDHSDAFKQLRVDEAERRFLGGQALNGWFVYCR